MTMDTGSAVSLGRTDNDWRTVGWRVGRGLLLAAGVLVFIVGVLSIRVSDAERLVPIEPAVATVGSDYTLLAVVGLVAVGLATLVVVATYSRGTAESMPPPVESVPTAPAPGRRLDVETNRLRRVWSRSKSNLSHRDRLKRAAVGATARAVGCSEAVARQRVADGTWTENEVAAWWLAEAASLDAATQDVDRSDPSNPRIVRQTVHAIAQLAETAEGADSAGQQDMVERADDAETAGGSV